MNEPAHISPPPPPSVAKEQAAAHYATVSEQADELKVQISQARTNIKSLRRAIEEQEDFIVSATERRQKLLKKKQIFRRAQIELEGVDEE